MGLRRQADNHIEIVVFEIVEGARHMAGHINADFRHGRDRKRVQFAQAYADGGEKDLAREQAATDRLGHRRAH